jgi:hypothetical protein
MTNRRRAGLAALALVVVVAAIVMYERLPGRGAPTAREAVQRYLDALARRDEHALRDVFTSGSSRTEIAARLRDYGGPDAASATFRILEAEPPFRGVPHTVVLTFRPSGARGPREDLLQVRERKGRWLLVVERPDPSPTPCASGAVCDAASR